MISEDSAERDSLDESSAFLIEGAHCLRETSLAAGAPFHNEPNFADLVASGSADRGRFPGFFKGLTILCSFYFAQERQEENFTGVSEPEAKSDRSCQSTSYPRTPKPLFLRVGSLDQLMCFIHVLLNKQ